MHYNSLLSYYSGLREFNAREQQILAFLCREGAAGTDRQIMAGLGYSEPNCVRPRITGLIESGVLEECGAVRCPVTGKRVRLVRVRDVASGQMELRLA